VVRGKENRSTVEFGNDDGWHNQFGDQLSLSLFTVLASGNRTSTAVGATSLNG
jgi:hypothetical protein